jgi:hypothetical protein
VERVTVEVEIQFLVVVSMASQSVYAPEDVISSPEAKISAKQLRSVRDVAMIGAMILLNMRRVR